MSGGADPSTDDERDALPRRILVAGSSGAGKSTLAREVSARLSLPYTELDSLFHGPGWTPRESFQRDVAAIVATDAWVSEWQYTPVRPLLLERAELLIALDYSRVRVMTRVVRRTLHRRRRRVELWNGNREPSLGTFFSDREHIVRWAWDQFGHNRRRMRALEQAPPAGLIVRRFRSPRETDRWLATLVGG
jgi:adenylate kinase family enzyme